MPTLEAAIHDLLEDAADAGEPDMTRPELESLTLRLARGLRPLLLAPTATPGHPGGQPTRLRDPGEATPREVQILAMVADGGTSEDIAKVFAIKADTVRGHLARLSRRWGVVTSAALVDAGFWRGLLPVPRVGVSVGALSGRELEVLGLLASGLGSDAIAERLVISQATVQNHARMLRAKLGARSKAHAVAQAWRSGLLPVVTGSGEASERPRAPSRPRAASAPPTASYGPSGAVGAVRQ